MSDNGGQEVINAEAGEMGKLGVRLGVFSGLYLSVLILHSIPEGKKCNPCCLPIDTTCNGVPGTSCIWTR